MKRKLIKAVKSSNPQRDGYYLADGAGTRREITYEQALELAKDSPNLVVNYYKDNVGGTGRLHWDKNQNQFIDNNEYFGKKLDNIDVVKFINQPIRQLTDAIPISTHVLEYRSDITPNVDFTNTDQNMFHRRDVANADAAVREALSSDVVDHVYDYMTPSTWAGTADKLFDRDENGNLKYNFFTDFNKVFNPTYDNQGWVGLVGADKWADEHPEATGAINFATDLLLPVGMKDTKLMSTSKPIMNYKLAKAMDKSLGPVYKDLEYIAPGKFSPYEQAVIKHGNSVNIPTHRMNWVDRLYYDALKNKDSKTLKTLLEYQYTTRNGVFPTNVYHGSPKTDIYQFAGRKVLNSGYSDGTFLFPEEFSQNANYYISKFGKRDGKVYPLFIPMNKFNNIVKFDGLGKRWNAIPEKIAADAFSMSTKELHNVIGRYGGSGLKNYSVNQLARLGSDLGKDMVIADNIKDAGPLMRQTQYMLMKPQTLKLQNPVTFDDAGNIIPLTQRFNLDIYDTRFAHGGKVNRFDKGGLKDEFADKYLGIAVPATTAPVIINSGDTIRSQKHN